MTNDHAKNFEIITGYNFDSFYNKYRPKLIWYLTKYTKDQEKASDFADDAFTQALTKINNYDKDKSQIHTWIYKIGENLVKKEYKDRKRINLVSIDKDNEDNLSLKNIISHERIDDMQEIEFNCGLIKKADVIRDAIYQLPEKYKKVMILREIENKAYLEIADLCTKEYSLTLNTEIYIVPDICDFKEILIDNIGNELCFLKMFYNNTVVEIEINPKSSYFIDNTNIVEFEKIEVECYDVILCSHKTTTNLSTIKSQISKGRHLLQEMVINKFKYIDEEDDVMDIFKNLN
jgi:RNA polymerase sigma-70 factor (ECF subfamily)